MDTAAMANNALKNKRKLAGFQVFIETDLSTKHHIKKGVLLQLKKTTKHT